VLHPHPAITRKKINEMEVVFMKQLGLILLLLSLFLYGPGCKKAEEEPVSQQEKSPVQEQTQKKSIPITEKEVASTPQNPMKLESKDAKLKIVAGEKNMIGLELENTVPIRGVQCALKGTKISEIRTTNRTKGYLTKFNEATGIIILVDMSGKKIPPGTGPIAEVVCDNPGSASLSDIKLAP
jgi:hypothetical protein